MGPPLDKEDQKKERLILICFCGSIWHLRAIFVQQSFQLNVKEIISSMLQKNWKLKNKSAFVFRKYIKWLTYTVDQFKSVCTLKFQAYGHGNSYQYSKAIEDVGDIQKRARAVKQSTKSSALTHAHQTVCRLSQSLNGTKSKVADASGWSALLRYSTRGLFRQLQHWLHCVKANQRGKWREQPCRTHTMHKWQRSDGDRKREGAPEIFKGTFWDAESPKWETFIKRYINRFVKLKLSNFMKKMKNSSL